MKTISKLLLILSLALTFTVSAQDTLRVKVMTYNLRFGELATLDELASHIKSFKPDFVALQEVDCHVNRKRAAHQAGKDFIAELAFKSGMFGLYGRTIDYAGGYYGIGILSKFPYISTQKTMLPRPLPHEPRALLEGVFEMGNDTIIFASTHLDVKEESTRVAQAQFISDHFKGAKYPIILGGDFNARPYSKPIKDIMMKSWFQGTNDDLTIPSWGPTVKIDYLFARPMKGWRVVSTQTIQSQLSDHLPIVTIFEYIKEK
ncbi:MAG: endonuclease/exonuclease/phosphatase family protein [Muribaculaceae bacterium]|nr:endonuclease/exonuclease/phosphatase family protein [Muribaculaceae bacterium]